MCSFDNHPDLKKCEMCETSRESYSNISEAIGGNNNAVQPYMFYPVPVFFANHPNQAMAMLDNGFFPPSNFPDHFLSAATNNPFIPVFALDNRTNDGFMPCGIMSNGFVTSDLGSNGFVTSDLGSNGFVTSDLGSNGFVTSDLGSNGFVTSDLGSNGFVTSDLGSNGFVTSDLGSNGFVTSDLGSNGFPTNHSLPINDYNTNRVFELNDNGNNDRSDNHRSSVTTLCLSPSSCSSHTHCYCHKNQK